MGAHTVCQQVLNQLKLSNLNFIISETPYSAQIMLRKRFLREANGPSASFCSADQEVNEKLSTVNRENIILKEKIKTLELAQTLDRETIKDLKNKVAKAEANGQKQFEKNKLETTLLKTSNKNLKNDLEKCNEELNYKAKIIKKKKGDTETRQKV